MKIAFLTNNDCTLSLAQWIKCQNDEDSLIIYREKITAQWVASHQIDYLISYNYKHIIKPDVLKSCDYRAVNLHTSLLPWNRGADPNIWSFIENTPKGVTIHRIDAGLDTGDILLQKSINFDDNKETFDSSYKKLQDEISNLFKENWNSLRNCCIPSKPQHGAGSFHYKKELDLYRRSIDFNKPITEVLKYLKLAMQK